MDIVQIKNYLEKQRKKCIEDKINFTCQREIEEEFYGEDDIVDKIFDENNERRDDEDRCSIDYEDLCMLRQDYCEDAIRARVGDK